ncbi:hypothetical protein AB0D67_05355 [Streptosporangium sp. NPDC048047]|uniref:hypothetical protein n=1 Tax=Streptosporangium sp. NPDC048047 TaxID=3155748 RepID=UPI003439BF69
MITIDTPLWAARLRARRRASLWSRRELGERVAEAAGDAGRDRLPLPDGPGGRPGTAGTAGTTDLARMVASWEAGERPDEMCAEWLCRAFGAGETGERGLFGGEAAGTTLWHHLTGVPLMPERFSPDDEERTGRAIEDPARADDRTVAYFEAVLDAYTRTDTRPATLAGVLAPVFGTIQGLRRDARPAVHRSLLRLSSQDADLISRMCCEAGDPEAALAWSDRALRAAREAGDERLVAYALAHRAGLAESLGDPGEVIGLAVAVCEHVAPAEPPAATARRHEARGHAMAGEGDMCHRCLEECAEAAATGTPEARESPGTAGVSGAELAADCLIDLHRPADAIEMLERELPGAPAGYMTAYAMARLAHAYADAHEDERSAATARAALALSRRTGAARAMRELLLIHGDAPRWMFAG